MPMDLNVACRSAPPAMLVVVHDFSSVFLAELNEIVNRLTPLVGRQISAAIVPRWHGGAACFKNDGYRKLLMRCSEHLLHGWTHQSAGRFSPISLLTDSAAEFRALSASAILKRIESAQADFQELTGHRAEGLLAPAWQLPIAAARLSMLKFVLRFDRLELCGSGRAALPLATWSWDWGRVGWLAYGGEWLGHVLSRVRRVAIPCIAIHPIDVRRGYLARALSLISNLIQMGYRALTASEILSEGRSVS